MITKILKTLGHGILVFVLMGVTFSLIMALGGLLFYLCFVLYPIIGKILLWALGIAAALVFIFIVGLVFETD